MKKKVLGLLIVFSLLMALSACNSDTNETPGVGGDTNDGEPKVLRVVTVESQEPNVRIAEKYLNEQGYELKVNIVELNNMIPEAITDGSADLGMGVHLKFMEQYNEKNDGKAHMAQPYPYYDGIGLFSRKYDSLEELPDDAKIALMSDAMNQDRGLRMMEGAGLIELAEVDDPDNTLYSLADVVDDSHNYELMEMDQTQTIRALEDVDASLCFHVEISNSGESLDDEILTDPNADQFPGGFVIHEDMKGTDFEKVVAESLRTDEIKEFLEEKSPGVYHFFD